MSNPIPGDYSPVKIRNINKPISKIDPNIILANGQVVYGKNSAGVTVSHKVGDGITPYHSLPELAGSGTVDLSGYYTKIQADAKYQPTGNYALESEIAVINAAVASKENQVNKGNPNGYASLDSSGKVPVAQIPPTVTTSNITVNVAEGSKNPGDIVPAGTTLQQLATMIFSKTFTPVLTAPSFSLTCNTPYAEIGASVSPVLTFNFNRGSIYTNGVFQNYYSGDITSPYYSFYHSDGTTLYGSQFTNAYTVSNYVVNSGVNSFKAAVSYSQGPQPMDNFGVASGSPLPAGTSPNQTASLEGVYPIFATTVSTGTMTKQPLVTFLSTQAVQYTMVSESGGGSQRIDIPPGMTLHGVYYYNTLINGIDRSANKIGDFLTSTTSYTIQGNTVNGYNTFTHNTAALGSRGSLLMEFQIN